MARTRALGGVQGVEPPGAQEKKNHAILLSNICKSLVTIKLEINHFVIF